MKDLIKFIASSLVDHPSEVDVFEVQRGNQVILELQVAKEDMGRIIGREGRVANAIRVLLRVAAAKEGKRVSLDIIEPE